jgi:hypothetical protein
MHRFTTHTPRHSRSLENPTRISVHTDRTCTTITLMMTMRGRCTGVVETPENPGETTTATVSFAPGGLGPSTAELHIASNDTDENPFDIELSGNGTNTEIVVEYPLGTELTDGADQFAFGDEAVGGSQTRTVTISNSGSSNLNNLSTSVVGSGAAQFIVTQPGVTSLGASESTTFDITFEPGELGDFSANLQIGSNDSDENPFNIALTGTGLRPEIHIEIDGVEISDGSEYYFEDLIGLTPGTRSVEATIRNIGNVDLLGLDSSLDGADVARFNSPGLNNSTLAPGESRPLYLLFIPNSYGNRTAAIHITSNDADENPYDINLFAARIEPSGIGSFADGHGLTEDGRLLSADGDDDTVTLLEEYAYNLDPSATDVGVMQPGGTSGLPLIRVVGDRLQVEYLRRRGDPDLTYSVEFGNEISDNSSDGFKAATEPETISYANDNYFRVIVRDSVTIDVEPSRFGRVKVSYPSEGE